MRHLARFGAIAVLLGSMLPGALTQAAAPQPATSGGARLPQIAVVINTDGRQEVFEQAAAGRIRHRWQLTPGGVWSEWKDAGAPADACCALLVAMNTDGRLEMFATLGTGAVV